jgi:hypothetical protein
LLSEKRTVDSLIIELVVLLENLIFILHCLHKHLLLLLFICYTLVVVHIISIKIITLKVAIIRKAACICYLLLLFKAWNEFLSIVVQTGRLLWNETWELAIARSNLIETSFKRFLAVFVHTMTMLKLILMHVLQRYSRVGAAYLLMQR